MTPTSDDNAADDSDDFNFTEAELRDLKRQSKEFNSGPLPHAEIDELLAGLDDLSGPDFQPDGSCLPIVPRWMEDLKIFRGRHGPFSTVEVVRIIQELNKAE